MAVRHHPPLAIASARMPRVVAECGKLNCDQASARPGSQRVGKPGRGHGMSVSRRLEEEYRAHPILRGLLQLVLGEVGSALDTAIANQVQKMREERLEAFFQELKEGERDLTPELVQSEPFLQAYFATTIAALRTKRREKIAWFGRLLLAATGANPGINLADEHEDYLKILDELTYRELGILATLAQFEAQYPDPIETGGGDVAGVGRYWAQFTDTACQKFPIRPEELPAIMIRLNRTGMYETLIAFAGGSSGTGKLTATYYRLAKLIRLQGNTFVP